MLQALLVERFQLAVHREKKVTAGFALTVDRKGARIQSVGGGGGGIGYGPAMVRGSNVTMAQFAEALAGAVGRPVKDLTKLSGGYDIFGGSPICRPVPR